MFETRSKDGRMLFIVSYSFSLHVYNRAKYYNGEHIKTIGHKDLEFILANIENERNKYDGENPTDHRYYKLITGDIYDNETETIVNHSALRGLLDGLENKDRKRVAEAIKQLTQ